MTSNIDLSGPRTLAMRSRSLMDSCNLTGTQIHKQIKHQSSMASSHSSPVIILILNWHKCHCDLGTEDNATYVCLNLILIKDNHHVHRSNFKQSTNYQVSSKICVSGLITKGMEWGSLMCCQMVALTKDIYRVQYQISQDLILTVNVMKLIE